MSRLEGYWPLDESSGDAIDYSGNSVDGTVNNVTQGATGILNASAYQFDGSSSYVDPGQLDVGTGSITVSAWVYFDALTPDDTILGAFDSASSELLSLKNNESNGQWQFTVGVFNGNLVTAETTAGSGSPATGQWYHVAGVADKTSGEVRLYVDGTEVATASGTIGDYTNASSVFIGARSSDGTPDRYFGGRIEEVRVYDRPLSRLEVKSIYDTGSTAYFKTDWQTFNGGNVEPTSTYFNIDASLNNQNIKAFIVSDIDGDDEIDEVSAPIDITANTQNVQPTGLPTNNDKFALLFEVNTTNIEEAPVINDATFSTTQEAPGPTVPTYTATDPVGTIQVGEKQQPIVGLVQPVTTVNAGIIQRNTFTGDELEANTDAGNYIPFREASFADTGVRTGAIIQETIQPSVGPVGEIVEGFIILIPTTATDPVGEPDEATRFPGTFIEGPTAVTLADGGLIFENVREEGVTPATTGEGADVIKAPIEEGSTTVATEDGTRIDQIITGDEFVATVTQYPSVPVATFTESSIDGFQQNLTQADLIQIHVQNVITAELNTYRVVTVSGSTAPVGSIQGDFDYTDKVFSTGDPGTAEVEFRVGLEPKDVTDTAAILNADIDVLNPLAEPFTADIQNIDIVEAFLVVDNFTAAPPTVTLVDTNYITKTLTAPIQNATIVNGQYITPTYEEGLAEAVFVDGQFLPETIFTVGQLQVALENGDITQATTRQLSNIIGDTDSFNTDRVTVFIASTPVGDVFAIGSLTFGSGRGVILRTNVEGIILTDSDYDRSTVS